MTLASFIVQWQTFFSTLATACATLIGLLFVAMTLSVNSLAPEENRQLMRVARDTLGDFLVVLMTSIMFLVPYLHPYGLALALFVIAIPWTIGATLRFHNVFRTQTGNTFAASLMRSSGLGIAGGIGLTVVGVLVVFDSAGALYLLVSVFAMLLAAATGTAWFLLSHMRGVPRQCDLMAKEREEAGMKKQQSSLTAEGIAIVRAMESDKPPDRRICYDPFARQLINPFLAAFVKLFAKLGYAEKRGPGVWEFLTARERYIDDYLQSCLENGVQQVVILGAGLDSRAYRFAAFQHGVKVFEVDHPATQKAKVAKIQRVMGTSPSYVTYVPVDFETETLAECLEASGYDRAAKTLFIWQGVVHYLTPEAVDSTLEYITHNSGQGSSVIFDYVYQSVIDGTVKRGEATAMRRNRRLSEEAMQFGIPQGTIGEFLEARGFDQVRDVTAADLQALYFTGVNAGRSVAPVYAIVSAAVKPREQRKYSRGG